MLNNFLCSKCKSKTHNSSICLENKDYNATKKKIIKIKESSIKPDSNCSQKEKESWNSINSVNLVLQKDSNVSCFKNGFLPTCTVEASPKFNYQTVIMLICSGSIKSYISKNLAKALNLKPTRHDLLTIYSFKMQQSIERVYPIVKFKLSKRCTFFKTKIQALVSLQSSGTISQNPYLKVIDFMKKHLEITYSYINDFF